MTVQEMIEQAVPSPIRAPWCAKMTDQCLSVLFEGNVAKAAAALSAEAAARKVAIAEVCRVTKKGGHEAVYARLERIAEER